jgi:hypothetical protein
MAAQALMLVEGSAVIQVEIENELEARDKTEVAWMALDDEAGTITADAARQFAAQSSGNPAIDTDAALVQFNAIKQKLDGVQAKKQALEFLEDALETRLKQLQGDAHDDYVAVLKRKIGEQEKAVERTVEDAEQAEASLERLIQELAQLDAGGPAVAAPGAAPAASGGAGAAAPQPAAAPIPRPASAGASVGPAPAVLPRQRRRR